MPDTQPDAPPRRSQAPTKKLRGRTQYWLDVDPANITIPESAKKRGALTEREIMSIFRAVLTPELLAGLFRGLLAGVAERDRACISFFSKHGMGGGKISLADVENPPTIIKT